MSVLAFFTSILRLVQNQQPKEQCSVGPLPARLVDCNEYKDVDVLFVYEPTWEGMGLWHIVYKQYGRPELRSDQFDLFDLPDLPEMIPLYNNRTGNITRYEVTWPEGHPNDVVHHIDMTSVPPECAWAIKDAFRSSPDCVIDVA